MTTETTQQTTLLSPVALPTTLYKPQWAVYVYDSIGYVTFNGRLIALEKCATAAQEDRLVATRDRLNHRNAGH
jgi:hypothetical protein